MAVAPESAAGTAYMKAHDTAVRWARANRDLLYEEAPAAYKAIEAVIGDLVEAGLVSVVATFRPLLTCQTRKARP